MAKEKENRPMPSADELRARFEKLLQDFKGKKREESIPAAIVWGSRTQIEDKPRKRTNATDPQVEGLLSYGDLDVEVELGQYPAFEYPVLDLSLWFDLPARIPPDPAYLLSLIEQWSGDVHFLIEEPGWIEMVIVRSPLDTTATHLHWMLSHLKAAKEYVLSRGWFASVEMEEFDRWMEGKEQKAEDEEGDEWKNGPKPPPGP